MSEMRHLTRYYVVDRDNNPVTISPNRRMSGEVKRMRYLNGPKSDNVRGVPERRPYRVVRLVPQEASDE
jgi:hypothetical protein